MPALPTVAGVIRLLMTWTDESDNNVQTRTYWAYSGGAPTSAQLHTWLVAIDSAWTTDMAPLYANTITLDTVEGTDLSSASGGVGTSTWDIQGTRSGTQNAIQVCAVVNYLLSRRYRGGKPKGFWPLGVQGDITGGRQWSSAAQSAFLTGIDNWAATVVGSSVGSGSITNQVNVSYYSGFTVVTNPITHRARNVPTLRGTPVVDTITARTIQPNTGTQRRRVKGGA